MRIPQTGAAAIHNNSGMPVVAYDVPPETSMRAIRDEDSEVPVILNLSVLRSEVAATVRFYTVKRIPARFHRAGKSPVIEPHSNSVSVCRNAADHLYRSGKLHENTGTAVVVCYHGTIAVHPRGIGDENANSPILVRLNHADGSDTGAPPSPDAVNAVAPEGTVDEYSRGALVKK